MCTVALVQPIWFALTLGGGLQVAVAADLRSVHFPPFLKVGENGRGGSVQGRLPAKHAAAERHGACMEHIGIALVAVIPACTDGWMHGWMVACMQDPDCKRIDEIVWENHFK